MSSRPPSTVIGVDPGGAERYEIRIMQLFMPTEPGGVIRLAECPFCHALAVTDVFSDHTEKAHQYRINLL